MSVEGLRDEMANALAGMTPREARTAANTLRSAADELWVEADDEVRGLLPVRRPSWQEGTQ